MIDDFAKEYLHSDLREIRETMLWKLDGLGEYDIRRPLTATGTNLLGLVKHLSIWESRYFGEVFDRPFPELLPRRDDARERGAEMWATEHETREEITDRYRRVWEHSDTTIASARNVRPSRRRAFHLSSAEKRLCLAGPGVVVPAPAEVATTASRCR